MKKTKKTKPSAETPAVVEANQTTADINTDTDTTPEVADEGFEPLTDEAFKWMTSKSSIPGAFPPILYCGPRTLVDISQIIGRSIELNEAMRLVQPDGPMQMCALNEGLEFQPVAYVIFCPGGLARQIENGATLLDAELPFGGQFYFIKGNPVPISGSVFRYDEANDSYDFASASPLVILAREFKKQTGRMQWGVPFGEVEQVLARKEARNQIHKRAEALVKSIDSGKRDGRGGLNPMDDAFSKAKAGKNGHGRLPEREKKRRYNRKEEMATKE